MNPPSPASARGRRGAWLLPLATLGWALGTLYAFSDGAISIYTDMLILYLGASAVGVAMLVTLVRGSRPGRTRGRRWPALVATLVILGIVPSACRYGWPFAARLALSREALTAAVKAGDARPGTIGQLHVEAVERSGAVTRFTTGSCGLGERCGIAYSPEGTPPFEEGLTYRPLPRAGAGWYAFARR
jgi:hypothetical protein